MTYDEHPKPRRAKPPKTVDRSRAFCSSCGQWPKITRQGNLSGHDYPKPWDPNDPDEKSGRCPGSGRPAAALQPELPLGGGTT